MKKLTTRFLCALLALSLTSCGGGSASTDTTTEASDTTTEAAFDGDPRLAFPKENNGDATFTILTPDHNNYDVLAEAENGEVVNDTVYARNAAVEDYFGITLDVISTPGHWDQREDFNGLVRGAVLAGDSTYDLVFGAVVISTIMAADGIYANLLSMPELNLDNPWWVSNMQDLAVDGKLFTVVGDASLSMYKSFLATYFNGELINQFGLENPFDLVKSGKWTIEKMIEMSENVTADLNNDGKIKEADDRYAMLTQNVPNRAWQDAFNINTYGIGDSGEYELLPLKESTVTVSELLFDYIHSDGYILNMETVDFKDFTKPLAENRALFMQNYLYATESDYLRNMEYDYGIVPYPKADEAQEGYHTTIATATSFLFVPKTVKNRSLTAKVMEAMSCFSTDTVIPAYYETALKDKYSRDENTKEMLNLIRETANFSFDLMHSRQLTSYPAYLLLDSEGRLASFYDSTKESRIADLANLMELYKGIEG